MLSYLNWIEYAAGPVWIALTTVMIWVLVMIYRLQGYQNKYFYWGIFLLIIVWLYPLYTAFFKNLLVGEIGNIITLIVTVIYALTLKDLSLVASRLMIPQIIWLTIAAFYTGLLIADSQGA